MALFQRTETARDSKGAIVSGAKIEVFKGKTLSDSSVPTIFEDADGLIQLSLPLVSNLNGQYSYWVESGLYCERVSKQFIFSTVSEDIFIGGSVGSQGSLGTATIDFGTYPGSAEASVSVTGQTGILAGSVVQVWVSRGTSPDHTAQDHTYLPELASFVAGDITPGVGFSIFGRCILGGLQGKWTLNWSWV